MKHRRWIRMLFAVLIVAAVFLLPGGVTEAEAAGPLSVVWREGAQVWESDVACGTPTDLSSNDFAGYYSIASNDYVVLDSVQVDLPDGFYYKDGSTSKQAVNVCSAVYPSIGITYGGYNDTAQIMIPYLPDAKAGDVYYVQITYTGRVYTRYEDRQWLDWQNYFYNFTQTVKVPLLKVKKAWDEVTVTDDELGTVTLKWDDTIFTSDYNQKAAEMAAVMSKIAYNESAMKQMLSDLGCYNVKSYNMGVNVNQIGYFTGEKRIVKNGETRKVTFAVGRGTNGKYFEWIGNVNLGSAAVHRGFQLDADQLYNTASSLRNQTDYGKLSDSFVFFTGHSQAAAAANIAAHKANNNKWNCVAYTFATPTVERGIGTTTSGEHGIYNWVYYQDAIRNSPSMARYGRYGSTTIFGYETPPDAYNSMDIVDAVWTDSMGVRQVVRYGFTMQEYLNAILYTANLDDKGAAVAKAVNLLGKNNLQGNSVATSHSMKTYYAAVKNRASNCDLDTITNRTNAAWKMLQIMDIIEHRVVAHTYYCPVNVYVYDNSGNLAGSIEGDQVTIHDDNLILYALLDSKVVMYQEDLEGNYCIEVTGYADGTVTHSTTYYSAQGTDEMLVSRTIPVSNGQTISFATDPHGDSSYTTYTDEAQIEEVVYDLLGVVPEEETMPFTDVPEGKWYYDYVDYVYQNGLMNGVSDTTFEPTGTMTRAMLATVIYRAAGSYALENEMPFTDVPVNKWYTDAVNWAYINNIVNGTSATTFSPNAQITREQIVTMFYRYAQNWQCDTSVQADLSGYTDAESISNYAKEPFRWAVAAGIINGTTDTTLAPKAEATRAQCAAIMQRFNEYIGQ